MTSGAAGPSYFGPEQRRLFGWFHPAAGNAVGVVLCNPFGFEAIATHRSLRHFAETFARAGIPALRFDYDGTGDSAGTDRDPDRVRAWLDSIHAAVEALKERSGVGSVVLLGLRLGATLAATAAAERTDVKALIALAPVLNPALYIRELEAYQAWSKLIMAPEGVPSGLDDGDKEASGFVLTAATCVALAGLELPAQKKAPAPNVLVFDRIDRAQPTAWPKQLASLGVTVDARRIEGFVEMNAAPHDAEVPEKMIAETLAWLRGIAGDSGQTGKAPQSAVATTSALVEDGVAGPIRESAVFVDAKRTLFGIVAHPEKAKRNGRAIVLLNAGAQHRIGPNRLWVTLARYWARHGFVVLRLDLSGIGDSPNAPGARENRVYADAGASDVGEAIAHLRQAWGAQRFDVIGLCGSAYHAFKAAVRGAPIQRVFLINQQTFFWDEANPKPPNVGVTSTKAAREVTRLRERALSLESWKKLVSGGVKLGPAVRFFSKRVADVAVSRSRSVARVLHIPLKDDLVTELRQAAANGVFLQFVFSDDEGGEAMLSDQGGSMVGVLQRRGELSIERIHQTDHTFTAVWTHRLLRERLDGWLGVTASSPVAPLAGASAAQAV